MAASYREERKRDIAKDVDTREGGGQTIVAVLQSVYLGEEDIDGSMRKGSEESLPEKVTLRQRLEAR